MASQKKEKDCEYYGRINGKHSGNGRCGGLMVSALVPGASGLAEDTWQDSASLYPVVQMGTVELFGKPNKLWGNDLRWTSIPSKGSRKLLLAASCHRNRDKLWQL